MKGPLRLEELEARIAPTTVLAGDSLVFTDSNGDHVTVHYDGEGGSQIDVTDTAGGDIDDGDDIGSITFTGATIVESTLVVACDGAGGNDIHIDTGIFAPAQDVSMIVLGFGEGGSPAGTVHLGDGAGVEIGGILGTFVINGDFDCDDGGHYVQAGGDISTIAITGDLILDPSGGTNTADFRAGGALGAGDIHFLATNDVYASSAAIDPVDPTPLSTAAVTIADDVGTGAGGFLTLKLSGGAATGSFLAVPVVGGGVVLSNVLVESEGTLLTIAATQLGGDVTNVDFDQAATGIMIAGAADTDVLQVNAEGGSLGSIVNKTVGGDIGNFNVAGDLGLVQSGRLGILGSIYTGSGNSMPIMTELAAFGGSTVTGAINTIKVGGIHENVISADSIGNISVTPAGINNTEIDVTGDLDSISAVFLRESVVVAGGVIGKVAVGGGGAFDSDVVGLGGIPSFVSKGWIIDTTVQSGVFDAGAGDVIGVPMSSFAAPYMIASHLNAYSGLARAVVKGYMNASSISTEYDDGGTYYGKAIGAVAVGGVGNGSEIRSSYEGVASVKVGSAGIADSSVVFSRGDVGLIQVAGDVAASEISVVGNLSSLKVAGELMQEALVVLEGDVTSVAIGGGIYGTANDNLVVLGHAGSISIKGNVLNTNLLVNSVDSLSISKSAINSDIMADGALGTVKIGGNLAVSMIASRTGIGSVAVKGAMYAATIAAEDYDGGGDPLPCDIGAVTAGEMTMSTVRATRDIGPVSVKGLISDSDIYALARNANGFGDVVGGGKINSLKALGFQGATVATYDTLGPIVLGSFGLDAASAIFTLAGADFAGLKTSGLVSGYIEVDGTLTGSILTAGNDAFVFGEWHLFTDANGQLTNGVFVGDVAPGVLIS